MRVWRTAASSEIRSDGGDRQRPQPRPPSLGQLRPAHGALTRRQAGMAHAADRSRAACASGNSFFLIAPAPARMPSNHCPTPSFRMAFAILVFVNSVASASACLVLRGHFLQRARPSSRTSWQFMQPSFLAKSSCARRARDEQRRRRSHYHHPLHSSLLNVSTGWRHWQVGVRAPCFSIGETMELRRSALVAHSAEDMFDLIEATGATRVPAMVRRGDHPRPRRVSSRRGDHGCLPGRAVQLRRATKRRPGGWP
jgi:hypothetical protein